DPQNTVAFASMRRNQSCGARAEEESMARLRMVGGTTIIALGMLLISGCGKAPTSKSEQPAPAKSSVSEEPKEAQGQAPILDEAQRAGRDAASFPQPDEDYFHDMDNGVALSEDEIKGRNMWLVWTGGNDRQWDELTRLTFGVHDLLK